MELGKVNNKLQIAAPSPQQEQVSINQTKIMKWLNTISTRWTGYTPQELTAMKACFLGMWDTSEAKNDPDAFAEKQLNLLNDMDKYPDLRIACFDLTVASDIKSHEKAFPFFLILQNGLQEMITNSPALSTVFEEPQHDGKEIAAEQKQRYLELGWQGPVYNKNRPSLEELDPGYKKQLYMPLTDVPLRNLNCKVCFIPPTSDDPPTTKIVCEDLVAQNIKDMLEDKSGVGKVDWTLYSSEESIAKHISMEIKTTFKTLRNNARRYDLIRNDKLGEYLCACFDDMQLSSKKETIRVLLLVSPIHAMRIRLRIKGTEEKPIYVVSFYDPNKTNIAVRCESDDLSTFNSHTLEQYINGTTIKQNNNTLYNRYYQDCAPISMVVECDPSSLKPHSANVTKKLSSFNCDFLTPTHIFFLLDGGFATELAQLQDQLREIGKKSPEQLFDLLSARRMDGTSGLFQALLHGHADVIKVYGELLQLLTETERGRLLGDLLAAKHLDGVPALFLTLQNGETEAIKAYGELLQLLPKTQCGKLFDLLVARRANGTPGLFMALKEGHAEAVTAYGKLLQPLIREEHGELVDLLAAKDEGGGGIRGLYLALRNGHAKAVEAYGELLQLLPQTERGKLMDLVAAKEDHSVPGLYFALQNGHAGAIKAYGKLFQLLLGTTEFDKLVDLLAAKLPDGTPGLYVALQNGHTETIKAYGELLQLLPGTEHSKLVDLLAAKRTNGKTGLQAALQNGHTEAMYECIKLMEAHKINFKQFLS